MINKIECVTCDCDICGDIYENMHSGFSIFVGEAELFEDMDSDGSWHEGDGTQGEEGKHYCPECFEINDEDEFVLKIKPQP